VYCTAGTHRVIRGQLGEVRNLQLFKAGGEIRFGPVLVRSVPTPHDAADGVAFVVEYENKRLGVFTDLGHPFDRLRESLAACNAAYLESNYDPEMLETGPYPALLKARIRGDGGHISNDEAAGLLRDRSCRPNWIALAHLSQENNRPDVALRTHRSILGDDYPLHVAGRDGPTDLLCV